MLKKVRLVAAILTLFLLCSILSVIAATPAAKTIQVILDGQPLQFDVPPQIINNRTMVPMRVIFEALGATVDWNGTTNTVTATKGDLVVTATIGSKIIYVDGYGTVMDVAPVIVDSRTLVPVRFVSQAFGCEVDWDASTSTVYIYSLSDNSGDNAPVSDAAAIIGTWSLESMKIFGSAVSAYDLMNQFTDGLPYFTFKDDNTVEVGNFSLDFNFEVGTITNIVETGTYAVTGNTISIIEGDKVVLTLTRDGDVITWQLSDIIMSFIIQ